MTKTDKKPGIVKSFKRDSENGARRDLLEELFNDFHTNRRSIYQINFIRGIFFGVGSVIGGTLLIAFVLWLLNVFIGWFPVLNDVIGGAIELLRQSRK